MSILDKLQPLALLALRLMLGAVMIAHGYGKVFGGMHRFTGSVANLGFPGWFAYLSAGAEFIGGILLIAGLVTRFAAFAVFLNMLVAVWKVHWARGFLLPNGYEYALTLATVAFALIFFGAGVISLDWVIFGTGGVKRK